MTLDPPANNTSAAALPPGMRLDSTPAAPPAATPPAQPGMLSRAWDWVNKGLVSGKDLLNAAANAEAVQSQTLAGHPVESVDMYDQAKKYAASAPTAEESQSPIATGIKKGIAGATTDTADTASSFTSPASIALAGTGALGKGVQAGTKVAKAVRAVQGAAGAGYAAQGGKQIYDAATQDKDENGDPIPVADRVQRGLIGAAMATGGAAGVGDAVRSPRGMMADRMNKTAPNEQFTPQEKLDAARAHDVNLDLADATGSGVAKAAKAATQHGLGASGTFEAAQEHNTGALNQWGNEYLDKLSPNTGEPAGSRIQNAMEQDLAAKQSRESQIFDELDKSHGVTKPDAKPIQQAAQKIIDSEGSYYQKHPDAIPSKAWKWVQNSAKDAGDTWSDIHKLRSDTMSLYRSPDVVGTRAEGFLKQLVKAQDDVLTSADLSKMSPEDTAKFREANDIHSDIKSTYDNPQHPFYHALRTPFASKSAEMMSAKTPELARQTNQVLGKNAGDFQRSVVENIMGRNPSGAGFDFKGMPGRLKNYKPEYLQSLLGSQASSELYKMARVGRDVTADSNPSGSGKVLQKAREGAEVATAPLALASGHPAIAAGALAVPLAEKAVAATMTNPKVVDFLTKRGANQKPPRMAPGAISSAMAAQQQRR